MNELHLPELRPAEPWGVDTHDATASRRTHGPSQLLVNTRAETGEPTWDPRAYETPTGSLPFYLSPQAHRKCSLARPSHQRNLGNDPDGPWLLCNSVCSEPLADLQLPQCSRVSHSGSCLDHQARLYHSLSVACGHSPNLKTLNNTYLGLNPK